MTHEESPPINFSKTTVEDYRQFLEHNNIPDELIDHEIAAWAISNWGKTYYWIDTLFPRNSREHQKMVAKATVEHNNYYGKYSYHIYRSE